MPRSWEQILGGFATNTLTEDEKRQLYEAALDDQALFNALADEEALRALLADPAARQRILDSLPSSEKPQYFAAPSNPRLRWYRNPYSLAWAGSLAAMGLVLIFGWQMESLWGPVVREELQAERAEMKKNDEVGDHSQMSEIAVLKKPSAQEASPPSPRKREGADSQPAPVSQMKPPSVAQASKELDRVDRLDKGVSFDRVPRQATKPKLKAVAKAPALATSPAPSRPRAEIQQEVVTKEQFVPSLGSSKQSEDDRIALSPVIPFGDQVQLDTARPDQEARGFSYSSQEGQGDVRVDDMLGMRAPQSFGEPLSSAESGLQEKAFDLPEAEKFAQESVVGSRRSLRYRFVQERPDGTGRVIPPQQFSGDWGELYLVVESNIPGYLYVLSEVGKRQWQFVKPQSLRMSQSARGAIEVGPAQSVRFALDQLANSIGKPIVSSLVVLLSSTPIPDLGRWVGGDRSQGQSKGLVREQDAQDTIIIDLHPSSDEPLVVNIPLLQ